LINNTKNAVIKTDQTNKGILWNEKFLTRILKIVHIKLTEFKIEEAPAKNKLKVAKPVKPHK